MGELQGGAVTDCINRAEIGYNSGGGRDKGCGGIVGKVTTAEAAITRCASMAQMEEMTSYVYIGGIVGKTDTPTTLDSCYTTGKAAAFVGRRRGFGGLCGRHDPGKKLLRRHQHNRQCDRHARRGCAGERRLVQL